MTHDPNNNRRQDPIRGPQDNFFSPLSVEKRNELCDLLDQLVDEQLDGDGQERLADLISKSDEAQWIYISEMNRHAGLIWEWGVLGGQEEESGLGVGDSRTEYFGSAVGLSAELPRRLGEAAGSPSSAFHLSSLSYPLSPAFIGGPVFSYMVATVVLGMMLLSAWAYTITHDQHGSYVHNNSGGLTAPGKFGKTPELIFVGQVTGMKDCRWADPRTAPFLGSAVSLNRKYVLSSGLMEITYNSGAKAILEGPCAYEVDSAAGGFLSLGKLTARVDIAKPQAVKTQDQNPKSPSFLIPHPSSLFTVRTPTAIVTDLGTEFGVEVGDDGATISHVFLGSVRVEAGGDKSVVLRGSETVRVEKVGRVRETHHAQAASESVRFTHPTTPPMFVRRLHETPKRLDLLDIVAGGYGTGGHRARGIDPSTGRSDAEFALENRSGNSQYRWVAWHRLIDGTFIPDGRDGAVQLDSAGHAFDGFPETSGKSYGSIWSREVDFEPEVLHGPKRQWMYVMGRGEQFMPERRGLLGLCSNAGVTFNLEAVRRMYPDARPARFRAVAGMADAKIWSAAADGMADLWLFVDGKLKFKRMRFQPQDGAFKVDVELGPSDRFLTLVTTDGGNGEGYDTVVLGDPVLDMEAIESDKTGGNAAEKAKQ